ncbi:MAG: PDZ domain-containing protein [candidate division Zixibacteria bacterium]|nr:PDZ domain-containing protein [candidate division Zixibacteria bacterium]
MSPQAKKWLVLFPYVLVALAIFSFVYADYDSYDYDLKKLCRVAMTIEERYAEEVELDSIIENGINGMLFSLDSYSRYLKQDDYRDILDYTHGEFEGIGIEVDMRQNSLIIVSVLEGTPAYRAGLRPGDKIISVDGKLTSELSRRKALELMRGHAGSYLSFSILRPGFPDFISYKLPREYVEVNSVPFYTLLPDGIGYTRLTRFTETSYAEMKEALRSLLEDGAKSLIIDLRSNSGGLLLEAVKVAGLFMESGRMVVETRSRNGDVNRHYSSNDGLICTELPLVILIDGGTASAAEIVAGAIQDWDRGLIVGSNSYGKGLVQRILKLDSYSALKLTTSKYYTPSGRCLQKDTEAGKLDMKDYNYAGDSSHPVYYTSTGRQLSNDGGIQPDVAVIPVDETELIKALKRQGMLFDFAVNYVAEYGMSIDSNFVVDENIVRQFKEYLQEEDFDYKPEFEIRYDSFLTSFSSERLSGEMKEYLDDFGDNLEKLKLEMFDTDRELIKWALTEEILTIKLGPKARYRLVWLKQHPEIKKARKILNSPEVYSNVLTGIFTDTIKP